jgi:hypothetical protein
VKIFGILMRKFFENMSYSKVEVGSDNLSICFVVDGIGTSICLPKSRQIGSVW